MNAFITQLAAWAPHASLPINPISSLVPFRLGSLFTNASRTARNSAVVAGIPSPSLSSQLFAAYSRDQDVKALADVVGKDELSEIDKTYLNFGEAFETTFINQGKEEDRDMRDSLDRGWKLLSMLPITELTRVKSEEISRYIKKK